MNQRATGATTAVIGLTSRLRAWMLHHRVVAVGSVRELLKSPVASLMSWLMIGIALALPTILYVLLVNVSEVSGSWGGKPRVSVYLIEEASEKAGRALARRLTKEPGVESGRFISREEALEEFQQRSGYGEVLSTLDHNPLPHVIEIVPLFRNPAELATLTDRWRSLDLVERVSLDLSWLERLFAILNFSERLVTALALVLAAGVVLVMGNTCALPS